MTVYTVALSKGGSTKTITASELAYCLVQRGRSVLAIDLDPQGNFTTRCGITPETEIAGTAADVLNAKATAEEAAVPSPTMPGVDVLVGTHDLAMVEADPPPDLVTSLRDHLPTSRRWADVVIDTPPSLTGLTLAGLAAADVVIAPLAVSVEAYDQLARLESVIAHKLALRVRPGLRLHWIVPTRCDPRRTLDREVLELLHERYPGLVTSPVREAVSVRDAYTAGHTVSSWRPQSGVAQDYRTALSAIVMPLEMVR
jgi:chromosome partitioning protein